MNLYFLGFTDLLLSLCFDGMSKRRKNALLLGALLSFCVVCEIFLCTSFQTFWRRDFVTTLYLVSFFCHQAICIHCLLHPQPNIFIWKKLGHIWCADTNDLLGQKFPTGHPAVCSLLLPLLWESGNECVGFPCTNGRSFLLQSFRHKKWSSLHFQASFLVDLPFGCPLRQFKGAPSLPSICICYFPLPALQRFLPPHNSSEPNRRCSREI